ncbi:MAG: MotA/TolQ/ExbB proton channel family protein [Opitutales bacterium]|nr:MotA/TolQ/ExbB proton channel family protein [Opitutales bacterium]
MIANRIRRYDWMIRWILVAGFAAMATSLAGQEIEAVRETARSDSLISLLMKGGVVMIPLALCSVLAIAITFERMVSVSFKTLLPAHLEKEMEDTLDKSTGADLSAAVEFCEKSDSPLGRVYLAGLKRWEDGPKDADQSMGEIASLEIRRLRRSLRLIRLIATLSPLLGLLGTVIGMIQSFQTVALSSNSLNKAEMLSEGIYQAMVTTAAGLTIAIPTLAVFYFFNNKVDRIADEMQHRGDHFITRYFRNRFKLEYSK